MLTHAVRSALLALPDEGEVIVVDDRSAAPTEQALAFIDDPRLRLVRNERPAGPAGARNFGVSVAHGTTVLFLDDDDLMLPGYPAQVLRLRHSAPEALYGFSSIVPFRGDRDPDTLIEHQAGHAMLVASLEPFRKRLAGLGCGFWIDRNLFVTLGGIAEDILVNEDTEFSVRLLAHGVAGLFSPEPGVAVRQHNSVGGGDLGSLTQRTDALRRAGFFGEIIRRQEVWLATQPKARRHLMRRQLKFLARERKIATALRVIAAETRFGHRLGLMAYFGLSRLTETLRRR